MSWIRRGRIGADGWLAAEIPLAEESERYRVEVLSGESVIRSAEVTAPTWLYQASDELADFGMPLDQIELRVSQGGLHVPWGIARGAAIAVN